jgi:hypothetical protein
LSLMEIRNKLECLFLERFLGYPRNMTNGWVTVWLDSLNCKEAIVFVGKIFRLVYKHDH